MNKKEIDEALKSLDKLSLNINEGKSRPSLILKDMNASFQAIVDVREMGTKKYSRDNWSLSIGKSESKKFLEENLDSIYRHLAAKDDVDEETGCYHLAQAACRIMFALEYKIAGSKK